MKYAWMKSRALAAMLIMGALLLGCGVAGAADKPAADFTLQDVQGKNYSLAQFRGKVVVLNFFTIWCQPCREEMPDLNAIYKENNDKGVQLLGICLNADPNQLRFFVRQMNLDYPILNGTDKVNEAYGGIVAVPTTFIINKQGKIVQKIEGSRSKADFMSMIKPHM